MNAFDEAPETDQGRALFEELLWVHRMIRGDLETVRRLAVEVLSDLQPHELDAELEELRRNGPLWQLKISCLRYCRFVHAHHGAEDDLLFPALRRANPALERVVDRLEEDHRAVSDLLDAVEAAAAELTEDDGDPVRRRAADTLDALAGHLLAHLDFEELSAGPTMRRMSSL